MKPIIIHIPKTGGTSLVMNLLNLQAPPSVGFNYRHIDASGISNSAEIFNNPGKFQDQTIIILFRNLIERMESEYNFLRSRDYFRELFPGSFPKSFEEYISRPCSTNGVLKFLLGREMFSIKAITDEDLTQVISSLDKLNIIYGLTNCFAETLSSIEYLTNIKIENNIIKKYRMTVYKSPRDIKNWNRIEENFYHSNQLDQKLFSLVEKKFTKQIELLPHIRDDFHFQGDKYHSLLLYVNGQENACPLSIYKPKSTFIKENIVSLNKIHNLAVQTAQGDGLLYAQTWLKLFGKEFNINFNDLTNPLSVMQNITDIID